MIDQDSQKEENNLNENMQDLVRIASGMKNFENLDEQQIKQILSDNNKSNEATPQKKASKNEEYRAKVSLKKNQYISKIKEDLIEINHSNMIEALLFKIAKEIRAFSEGKYWNIELAYSKDFFNFKNSLKHHYFEAKTNIILKLWYRFTGKMNDKLNEFDPFKNITLKPKLNDSKKWGSEIQESQSSPWFSLLFGFGGTQNKALTIENSHFYGIGFLVQNLLSNLEEIFTLKNSIDPGRQSRNLISNEMQLYNYVTEKTLPVIKIFRIIEHLSLTKQNYPLIAQHILYFIAWVRTEWFELIESSLNMEQEIKAGDMEFTSPSFNMVFDDAIDKINSRKQIAADIDLDVLLSERKAIIQRIDFYRQIVPEISRRLDYLIAYLFGDILFHYFKNQDLHFSYSINDSGNIQYKSLEKWIGSKEIIKKEEKELKKSFNQQMQEIKREKISTNEIYGILRKAGDFIIILTSMATAFNEIFSSENRFRLTKEGDDKKYNFLKDNPYFSSLSNMVSFEDMKRIQDVYDMIFQVKKLAIVLDQESKAEIPENEIISKAKTLKGNLENLLKTFNSAIPNIEKISQSKEKFDKFITLFKQLEENIKDYDKLINN